MKLIYFFSLQDVFSGTCNGRPTFPYESFSPSTTTPLGNASFYGGDAGLGLSRGYVTYNGAGKQLISNAYVSNLKDFLSNPRILRFFSTGGAGKKSNLLSLKFHRKFVFFFVCVDDI